MATNELSESAKKLIEEWSNEKLTPEQVEYNRKASGETEEEGVRYTNEFAGKRASEYPTFSLSDGKVKLSGSSSLINSDIVSSASDLIKDYYKGADLSVEQNAESLQTALDKINEQIKSQLQYQEYADFLDKSGFSDEAYRNYALAKSEADPTTTTNLLNSKKKIAGYDKDGNLLTGDKAKTPAEWLTYWKENFTPEQRVQLWLDSLDALSRGETDDDLYKGIPYLIMGVTETENVPARIMNTINPFDEEGWGGDSAEKAAQRATVNIPIYGFDDVDHPDVFWDSFWSTNKEALGRFVKWAGGQTTPLERALGPKYLNGGIGSAEEWGKTNGIDGVTPDMINNISQDEWNELAKIVNDFWYKKNSDRLSGKSDAEILVEKYGKEKAAKIMLVRDFSTLPSTMSKEEGYEAYQTYKDYNTLFETEGYKSPYEKWGAEKEKAMQEHLGRLGVLAPSESTFGVVSGTIARILAEQAALSLVSGGALSASNIASNLSRGGWKLASDALTKIKLGQQIAARVPRLASAIHGLATSSAATAAGANGFRAGLTALKSADAAAKAIYVVGSIGNWAVREMGEDVVRGLVDDVVTKNSLDSQGNLDPNKLAENIYMNAMMFGIGKGIKGAFKGLGDIVSLARTRNIDGVELNASQRSQLSLFQKALDDQNSKILFRGFDDDGHPVVIDRGRVKVLSDLTASAETMKEIDDIASAASPSAARTIEQVLEDDDVPEPIREKIASIARENDIDTTKPGWEEDVKTKIQGGLTDDEIREAFPDGVIKVGDETIRIDTKEFTAGDVNRVNGLNFKTMDDAIDELKQATTVRDFTNAMNGIMRTARDFAQSFKKAVEEFAQANNMNVRDVMIEIRNSRIAGEETIPGLKELWYTYWKPTQDKLLDVQEQITGIRPVSHDFYFRDMIAGTFKPGQSGAWSIDNSATVDILSGDSQFDLAASSTARNTGKLAELASDKLEYDPEVLAREFVASRLQTMWGADNKGKVFAMMQEAHDAGEFNLTEAEAANSVAATEKVAGDVDSSEGVTAVRTEIDNVKPLGTEFADIKTGEDGEAQLTQDFDSAIKSSEDKVNALEKELSSLKEETTSEFDGKVHTIDDSIREMDAQIKEQQAKVDSYKPKTDPNEIPKMDYATRKELAKSYANNHSDYVVGYRRQNTGVDDWYSNGTGTGKGDVTKFETWGSDKGDLTNAVWLTTDEKWAESPDMASAGNYNGTPDQTVVVLIPRSLVADAGGEYPIGPDGNTMSLREFSEANNNKIVQTRGTENQNWYAARDANHAAGTEPVTPGMRNRLNSKYYDRQELVLFKDTQPELLNDSNRLLLEEYNAKHAIENKRFGAKAERTLREYQDVMDDLVKQKNEIDAKQAELDAEKLHLKELREAKKTAATKTGAAAVEEMADLSKKEAVNLQKKFNKSASKSNAAELISKNSGYRNRATRTNPGKVVGVNYMPGNPFGKFSSWVNDQFVKANSIKMSFSGYKADGTPTSMSITAYNGGYKMYAEAGSFARNVIVDINNGMDLWEAINKQVYNNGFFIEPSMRQRAKYGALTVTEQAAKVTDQIMDKLTKGNRLYKWSDVFGDDGTVKDTEGLISILTTRFRNQGINDFSKFLRKADWSTLTKAEQSWLNKRMYEMTASVNKKTTQSIIDNIMLKSMGLRYRSNMWFNIKNGQLQLTECQRLFTMNKVGDFGSTLKRLTTDNGFRQKVSDYTYVMAAESTGAGFSRADLDNAADAYVQLGAASTISKNGFFTDIDNVKARFKDFDDSALATIEGGEYAKNYILIAGFVAAGEKQGLEGAELDTYVRNRFNTEALAGTKVGKIGLNDSTIGQFAFMYLGFPIRDLTLQWHTIRGGGIRGDALGSLEYLAKMLGAKGVIWAMEAPWGYSLMDQVGLDPFGLAEQYDQMPNEFSERDPLWRWVDVGVKYNPFLQGAMTSAFADVYLSYRAAEETAREAYKEEHNGSTDGFEWSLADAGREMWADLIHGLTPGYTAYSRAAGELEDLDRGYRISQSGNRQYQANTDLGNVAWGLLTGRRNTTNAQDYYQTANPIRGLVEGGLPGLGQQLERAMSFRPDRLFSGKSPFRGFREFDPIDSETYEDWFDGSYQDQQNWNTGIYAFRDEALEIGNRYDKYAKEGTAINDMAARENELGELRQRVEAYVKAYTDKHPEGISVKKQNQLINIFNLGDYQPTLDEAFQSAQGDNTSSDWDMAENRYAQGNFPAPYGMAQSKEGENTYAQSPQLEQVLSQHRYGISSDVAPTIEQMYKNQKIETPLGNMTVKDYHDKVYAQLQGEWDKSKPDYDRVAQLQEEYLDVVSKEVIQPILNTYGSSVLSAGKSSDIMQEFGKMLNGMIPSDQYRLDKRGRKIYQSTPYMTVDIQKWLQNNFKAYNQSVNTTNKQASERLDSIRKSLDNGRTSTAKSKARALIQDIGNGRASVSRDELEWLQGVLND